MPILSDYTDGTITVAAGGTVVTGSGTAWLTAGFAEGDEFYSSGYPPSIIASVDSETQLTLYAPWRGGALNAAPYRLRYQSSNSRAGAKAQALVDLLGKSGNLEAFAALVSAPDKLPYFTGAGQGALTDFKAAARSLLGLTAAADKLPYFTGANTAGLADFKAFGRTLAATADITAARTALQMTDYVRTGASQSYLEDANALTQDGQYIVDDAWTGSPFAGSTARNQGYLQHYNWGNSLYKLQVHTQINGGNHRRYRIKDNGVWQPWTEMPSSMLGSVSQTGGVPSGAVFESGSNGNGRYLRMADGTQMCWSTVIWPIQPLSTLEDVTWSFPANFVDTNYRPLALVEKQGDGSGSISSCGALMRNGLQYSPKATSSVRLLSYTYDQAVAEALTVSVFAIGRWF